jgi:hypothetical protein
MIASDSFQRFHGEHTHTHKDVEHHENNSSIDIEIVANKFKEFNTLSVVPPPPPVIKYTSDPPHEVEEFTLISQ